MPNAPSPQESSPALPSLVGPSVDRPERIEPHYLMGCIDHCLGRSGQRFQRRPCQPSVTCRIAFEVTPVSLGDGCADLIHHAGGRYQCRVTGACGLPTCCDFG